MHPYDYREVRVMMHTRIKSNAVSESSINARSVAV